MPPVAMFSCSSFIFVELIFQKKRKPLRLWVFYHAVTCGYHLTPANFTWQCLSPGFILVNTWLQICCNCINLKDLQYLSCSLLWAADQYLPDTMNHVLSCVKKEKERTAAFQALGLLSVAVRSEFQAYLPKVLEIIKAALPPKDFAHK